MSDKGDDRLKRPEAAAKADRAMENREITEDRELSDELRLELLRGTGLNTILPDIPPIPGYHICWLSQSNPRDTIPQRIRLGYTPVRPSDVPGFNFHETSINRGGTYGDVIAINEMIAFKLPEHLYQLYMKELHHTEPNKQEAALRETAERIRNEAQGKGADVIWDDGMEAIALQSNVRPQF
jgi:hypothetical protein